jgi:hypothetical protein
LTDLGRLKKHLLVWYEWKVDDNGKFYLKASMEKLIGEIEESLKQVTGRDATNAATPGYPGKALHKNEGHDDDRN